MYKLKIKRTAEKDMRGPLILGDVEDEDQEGHAVGETAESFDLDETGFLPDSLGAAVEFGDGDAQSGGMVLLPGEVDDGLDVGMTVSLSSQVGADGEADVEGVVKVAAAGNAAVESEGADTD